MKKFDVEIKRNSGSGEPLPAGGYVAKILNAKVESGVSQKGNAWEQLVISFDIVEGEYKDFFATQYRENTNEDKKWKGNFRLTVPQEDNQYYDSQKRTFGNCLACIEESNSGYHWDWDEAKLKGKMVGVLFREREWEWDGKSGITTECCTFSSVDDIRNGNFKMPKPKLLNKTAIETKPSTSDFEEILDDDLPFA